MLTTSTAPSDQLSSVPRLTESLPPPQATTTTAPAAAAMAVDPLQLAPVQDLEVATRAQAEPPQVQVSCSTEGRSPNAPTLYEKGMSEDQKSFLCIICVAEKGFGNEIYVAVF